MHYHTWKDVCGPVGLVVDAAVCSFILMTALCTVALAIVILLVSHLIFPFVVLLTKLIV
jgi:hypothetical protein